MPTAKNKASSSTFTGFPERLFTFLEGLEADNSKAYFDANRDVWDEVIQPCVHDLMADLEPEFGNLRTFRPNRDVRFSQDKSPYKTWIGVTTSDRAVGGIGSFLRVESGGLRIASGAMAFAPDQIKRFRTALDNPAAAGELDQIARGLAKDGIPLTPGKQPTLQRMPKGFSEDHPRSDWLRWKGAVVVCEYDRAGWMNRAEAADRVREVWAGARPLVEWIHHHVGESDTQKSRAPK